MEFQAFTLQGSLKREVLALFTEAHLENDINLVIFLQDTGMNLFDKSDNSDKDICLLRFFDIAEKLIKELSGYWCDYIDPSSGLPMKTLTNNHFSDIDACCRLLKLNYVQSGGCMLMEHPKYGCSFYPSTFITNAPIEKLVKTLENLLNFLDN